MTTEKIPFIETKFINRKDDIKWETRISVIKDADGNTVSECTEVEVPSFWSQTATDILASKYLRKAGLYGRKAIGETSLQQVVNRIVRTIRSYGKDHGYFENETESVTFENELSYMLVNQMASFNSPVLFNCGLSHEYGIKSSTGGYAWDIVQGKVTYIEDSYTRPQCSACFIQSIDDNLGSIYQLLTNQSNLFKGGSGTGTNFSNLRSKYEELSSGGSSSGLMSFLKVFDTSAGAIKSGGTTRRAASMICLDMDHPEIEDFIDWKVKEEKKAAALVNAGYSSGINGDAYSTVSGQNSNNSVRITDDFMNDVANDWDWSTYARTTDYEIHEYKARYLWDKIAQAAWCCADPGVQFDTTINEWHTCPNSGKINASNPCSEFMFLDDSACNLASLNLVKFLKEDNSFDCESFCHAIKILIIAMDILVDLSSYPTAKIAENSHKFRPLGLGYANLGGLLMLMGLSYDSDDGRQVAACITSILTAHAYLVSNELANKLNPFNGYADNDKCMQDVIKKHFDKACAIKSSHSIEENNIHLSSVYQQNLWLKVKDCKGGFRNAQVTLLAPTGTIGFLMDCATTGIEPDYSLVKYKNLVGGGYMKLVNDIFPKSLKKLGYKSNEIESIINHVLEGKDIKTAAYFNIADTSIFRCANGQDCLSPMAHLHMMAAVQPFLSGAISKTVNLSSDITIEEIKEIYTTAWKMGLKSVAIYRDKSKISQPLSSKKDEEVKKIPEKVVPNTGPLTSIRKKLPNKRYGFTQAARVGGQKIFLRTGEFEDGTLGEIFLDIHKEGSSMRAMFNAFAIAISLGLQHGIPLETFVKFFTFMKFEPSGVVEGHPNIKLSTSLLDFVFRVLGFEYLKRTDLVHIPPKEENNQPVVKELQNDMNVDIETEQCMNCAGITIRAGTCFVCTSCGQTSGCS